MRSTTWMVALLWVVSGSAALAQQPAGAQRAGFGSRPGLPPVVLADDEYIGWNLTPEQQRYRPINGYRMKQYIDQVVAISEKSRTDGVQQWGRYGGTIYDKMTRDWLLAQLKRVGLENVRDQPVTQPPRWWPDSWEASLVVDGKVTPLKAVHALGGPSTPANGVELPIVWVGLGTAADFRGRDVRGKAVLIHSMPTPTRREHSALWLGAIDRAREAGAAMVILNLAFPGMPNEVFKPTAGGGGEDAEAPGLTISLGSGETESIRNLIGDGKNPSIRYKQVAGPKGGPSGVVLAELPGMTDEWIRFEAHTDGDFWGALDNASGMAQMIELAQFYAAQPRSQRRRGIYFVANSDHHSGNAGLRWVEQNLADKEDKTIVEFVFEHPAQTQVYQVSGGMQSSDISSARRIGLGGGNGTETYRQLVRQGLKDFGVGTYTRPDGGEGDGSGFRTGPARVRLIDHTFYHSTMDRAEWVPAKGMEQATQALAYILDEINKLDASQLLNPKKPTTSAQAR